MTQEWFTRELLKARGSLFGFVMSLVRDFDRAEEVFQEVCVRLLEREQTFQQGTDFWAWAREFARRTVLEEYRRSGRVRFSDAAIEAVAEQFKALEKGHSAKREALRLCVDELDSKPRELIDLRYKEGLAMRELAARVGKTAGAVQVTLSRVRALLQKCIERRVAAGGAGALR